VKVVDFLKKEISSHPPEDLKKQFTIKDRNVMLSEKVNQLLASYLAEYKPRYWLFEGQ